MFSTEERNGPERSGKASTLGRMALETETINSEKERSGFACERGNMFIEGISFS